MLPIILLMLLSIEPTHADITSIVLHGKDLFSQSMDKYYITNDTTHLKNAIIIAQEVLSHFSQDASLRLLYNNAITSLLGPTTVSDALGDYDYAYVHLSHWKKGDLKGDGIVVEANPEAFMDIHGLDNIFHLVVTSADMDSMYLNVYYVDPTVQQEEWPAWAKGCVLEESKLQAFLDSLDGAALQVETAKVQAISLERFFVQHTVCRLGNLTLTSDLLMAYADFLTKYQACYVDYVKVVVNQEDTEKLWKYMLIFGYTFADVEKDVVTLHYSYYDDMRRN